MRKALERAAAPPERRDGDRVSERISIGPFELDLRTGELRRDGTAVPLAPQPTRLLLALARRRGELVTREEIRSAVWPEETFVDFDRGLNFCVLQVRTVLGDSGKNPRYIETIPRRGYRLAAPAVESPAPRPRRWLAVVAAAGIAVLLAIAWQRSDAAHSPRDAEAAAGAPASPAAHDAYLRGRYLVNQRSRDSIARGVAELRKATALDPQYALAQIALAEGTHALAMREMIAPKIAERDIRRSVAAALAAAPSLAQSHSVAAMLHFWYEWNWTAAEESYRRALALNPAEAGALHDHGWLLLARGRTGDGIALIRRAQELDPLSARANMHVAWAYIYSGRTALAIREAERALQLSPGMDEAYHCLEDAHLMAGDYDAALAVHRPSVTAPAGARAFYLAEWERLADAAPIAPDAASHPYDVAVALAMAGRIDPALDWLERARDAHNLSIPLVAIDPKLRALHGNVRFEKVVAGLGL